MGEMGKIIAPDTNRTQIKREGLKLALFESHKVNSGECVSVCVCVRVSREFDMEGEMGKLYRGLVAFCVWNLWKSDTAEAREREVSFCVLFADRKDRKDRKDQMVACGAEW